MAYKPPLTREKKRWAKNRDVVLRGTRLDYNIAQQEKYERSINRLVKQMADETKKEVIALFQSTTGKDFFKQQKQAAAMDESLSSQARILMNSLMDKFYILFNRKSKSLAEIMLDGVSKASKTTLYSSLKQLSGGLSLKTGVVSKGMEDVAKAIIEENVSLIKSIPEQYFKNITGEVMRSITTGRGLADLRPAIEKYDGQTYRRAKNIALDQTRKAYNSINAERMLSNNVKQFEWIHSGGGQHPRPSHQKISGHIFNFATLFKEQEALGVPKADRGIPGQAINCKCVMVPVIKFEDDE